MGSASAWMALTTSHSEEMCKSHMWEETIPELPPNTLPTFNRVIVISVTVTTPFPPISGRLSCSRTLSYGDMPQKSPSSKSAKHLSGLLCPPTSVSWPNPLICPPTSVSRPNPPTTQPPSLPPSSVRPLCLSWLVWLSCFQDFGWDRLIMTQTMTTTARSRSRQSY